nr:hypothetical protein [Streptomyces sp. LBUM 1481]
MDHSTGSRRGTAASVDRIIPVLYSPAESSTPSTPTARDAKVTPVSARLTASPGPAPGPGGPSAAAPGL